MRVATVAFLLLLSPLVFAQTPDTTSPELYFPLEVGNTWELRAEGGPIYESGAVILLVAGDTLVSGQAYFQLHTNRYSNLSGPDPDNPQVQLVRFDSTSAFVVVRVGEGVEQGWAPPEPYTPQLLPFPSLSALPCPLDSPFGATVSCAGVDVLVGGGAGYETGLGVDVTAKTFEPDYEVTIYERHAYGAGIGPLEFFAEEAGTNRLIVQFARISGVEYGTPIPVATEGAPPEAAVALSVFPNPAHAAATLRFSLDAPQRVALAVFDVLGRRVLAADLGVQPASEASHRLDLGALPAGLYVVRLTGDAGAQATTRLVRN